MNSNYIYFGRYEGWLRHLARGVRDGDRDCITKAAGLFDLMLPSDCVVVPMPSHKGIATTMLEVAMKLDKVNGRRVFNGLLCNPHEPSYLQKKDGWFPKFVNMVLRDPAEVGEDWRELEYYVIDNVVCTGITASSAVEAFKGYEVRNVNVCTIARSVRR